MSIFLDHALQNQNTRDGNRRSMPVVSRAPRNSECWNSWRRSSSSAKVATHTAQAADVVAVKTAANAAHAADVVAVETAVNTAHAADVVDVETAANTAHAVDVVAMETAAHTDYRNNRWKGVWSHWIAPSGWTIENYFTSRGSPVRAVRLECWLH